MTFVVRLALLLNPLVSLQVLQGTRYVDTAIQHAASASTPEQSFACGRLHSGELHWWFYGPSFQGTAAGVSSPWSSHLPQADFTPRELHTHPPGAPGFGVTPKDSIPCSCNPSFYLSLLYTLVCHQVTTSNTEYDIVPWQPLRMTPFIHYSTSLRATKNKNKT